MEVQEIVKRYEDLITTVFVLIGVMLFILVYVGQEGMAAIFAFLTAPVYLYTRSQAKIYRNSILKK